jgi:carbon monoxide dehydrogenase subunit G
MHITQTQKYAARPERVVQMLTDADFAAAISKRVNAVSSDSQTGDRSIATTFAVATPGMAAKIAGPEITLVQKNSFDLPQADGSVHGTIAVTVAKFPAGLTGTITIIPDGDNSLVTYNTDFTVKMPLVGPRLEKSAAPMATRAIEVGQEIGERWLAEHPE